MRRPVTISIDIAMTSSAAFRARWAGESVVEVEVERDPVTLAATPWRGRAANRSARTEQSRRPRQRRPSARGHVDFVAIIVRNPSRVAVDIRLTTRCAGQRSHRDRKAAERSTWRGRQRRSAGTTSPFPVYVHSHDLPHVRLPQQGEGLRRARSASHVRRTAV